MFEYWVYSDQGVPKAISRVERDGYYKNPEYFDRREQKWLPDMDLVRYILFGEVGWNKTPKEEAEEYLSTIAKEIN